MKIISLCFSMMIFFTAHPLPADSGSGIIVRFALVIGSNYGGPGRDRLRYAVSDANSFMKVLRELGGVQPGNSSLLSNPDQRNFYSAIYNIQRKISREKGKKRELFFYYSGHSDESGLLLGREKINYSVLKKMLKKIPADVRIAILDSCASGAFTRLKGGKKRKPFLFDSSFDMKGNAFMSSSSADEAAQESDKIKGSFFTHFLISGLRGAADVTQDNRITLNEAYQYAYNETLARTEKTLSGPQHANYNIQMTGTGDVILTDLRKGSASLRIGKSVYGRLFIHDDEDILVSEIRKPYGRYTRVSIEHGRYHVVNQRDGKLYEARIVLRRGKTHLLTARKMSQIAKEKTFARGDSKKTKRQSTLLGSNDLEFSGYGAFVYRASRAGDSFGNFVGGKGGLIINRQFVIGGSGFGLSSPKLRRDVTGMPDTDEKEEINFGYGGGMLEYYFFPGKLLQVSVAMMIGGGAVNYSASESDTDTDDESDSVEDEKTDSFFVVEPELHLLVNVTKYIRVGVGGSYRYVKGIATEGLSDSDFTGFTASVFVAFGAF